MSERIETAPAVPSFEEYRGEIERRWRAHPGGPFLDEIGPALRLGWKAGWDPKMALSRWEEVEVDLADHWYDPASPSEEMAWDQVRDAVRLGWETARGAAVLALLQERAG